MSYRDTQNTVSEKMGRDIDLNIYIKNEGVRTQLHEDAQRREQHIENQCDIVILNPFKK